MERVTVVGGGLAGSEAAWTLARLGVPVLLYEMRPKRMTPAHATEKLAEIVCSNSLGGEGPANAKGLLQAEMRRAGSLVMEAAFRARVPAGGALAVDREEFSQYITERLSRHPLVEVVREEVAEVPEGLAILATGPLTSDALSEAIRRRFGDHFLSYFDAASPIVLYESIDLEKCFRAGRYGQEADYLNCPLTKEEYRRFYQALLEAEEHTPHEWEKREFFEACVPVEELARRGYQTLLFGPMRPVGLKDPRTGKEPFAVVQLRQEDKAGRMWSLVGFQTGLKWPEQKRLIQMIPGLENAEIVRYGVMHRNTYLNAPLLLRETLEFKEQEGLFAAGVLAGVEGYLESAATGFLAGLNAARRYQGLKPVAPPEESMLGGLVRFLATANPKGFQPMYANWGLVPPVEGRMAKKEKREAMYYRGLRAFEEWVASLGMLAST
ncbi:methylenetetrahydrofolate--tRNA-(uracil(54)-C(5))-methyltransferase (FADH(2)-oxidizing) TrmFO [Thermus sp. PS18]|uniref:methylenetetrahydrofolate--tRNA-(uracil(54)- C(5))-methyltransferase (FADH(2)-oxidizing) TrmFO n=1 Tax=Thermus sp. PS18 TaxID=2849039 RepID=UPI0022641134|nr:methylenetetrahydrofolate--tRNA-(uracil(54)-C(5))-methyltransferase (FADH(2)-oxidizing) TrmFO [Thermus sp. PS18]UZX15315.1 methylenetetrahydrofolate--tRNA-(uracil(54)-C(5))-methyltransferase (FADH(2)-oxidizing) TrmFO [Thermus sp. PS18]